MQLAPAGGMRQRTSTLLIDGCVQLSRCFPRPLIGHTTLQPAATIDSLTTIVVVAAVIFLIITVLPYIL